MTLYHITFITLHKVRLNYITLHYTTLHSITLLSLHHIVLHYKKLHQIRTLHWAQLEWRILHDNFPPHPPTHSLNKHPLLVTESWDLHLPCHALLAHAVWRILRFLPAPALGPSCRSCWCNWPGLLQQGTEYLCPWSENTKGKIKDIASVVHTHTFTAFTWFCYCFNNNFWWVNKCLTRWHCS